MMKALMFFPIIFCSLPAISSILFMNSYEVNAFDTALSDFKNEKLQGYSSFIKENNEFIEVIFIEHGDKNGQGRPFAYGKTVVYKVNKGTNNIVKKSISFSK